MLSSSHKNLIDAARLGLRGERVALSDFLQKVAIDEINKKHHDIHNSITKLLREEGFIRPTKSGVMTLTEAPVGMGYETFEIEDLWLTPALSNRISKLLDYLKRTKHQTDRRNFKRVLLYGPPGTGKTSLGFYIAAQLNLPVRYVRVSDMISSRLGETMKNISNIFAAPGNEIIFIDEFDAFAKTRIDTNDVGELKRIVNSIIQTLDFVGSEKVVIVATNLVDSIDPAILRRFPFKIEVPALNTEEKREFLNHLMRRTNQNVILSAREGEFLLDILNLLGLDTIDAIQGVFEKAQIEAMLGDRDSVNYKDFLETLLSDGYLTHLKKLKVKNNKLLGVLLQEIENLGYSRTHVSSMLGIHRNTYSKYALVK